ncbi:MAG: hypothetical protein K2X37_02210 [Chitinophagaceae bacterium]|nr:hypothetical protein [Chitinophagaceae bacterium]
MKFFLFIIGFLFCTCVAHTQDLRAKREQSLKAMADSVVQLPFTADLYKPWKGAFWAMELMLYKPAGYEEKLKKILEKFATYPESMQWILLQNTFTLFPRKYANAIRQQFDKAKTDRLKALMYAYCKEAGMTISTVITDSFFQSDYYRRAIAYYTKPVQSVFKEKDFLSPQFLPKENLLVSFQYRDRNIPGYLMIRTEHGDWLKDASGKPLRFTQLARSITNMPYFLTNGNTPQGLYRVNGFDISTNSWIGPTTNLQIVMPFETEVSKPFFTDTTNATSSYGSLLGSFAKNNELWESYWAGFLGRSEIIAHGTTIPEWFYKEQPYYPCTPSLGCLCSPEIWDKNGKLVSSVQQQWIQLVQQLPAKPNWLLVVEL